MQRTKSILDKNYQSILIPPPGLINKIHVMGNFFTAHLLELVPVVTLLNGTKGRIHHLVVISYGAPTKLGVKSKLFVEYLTSLK